MTPPTLVGSPVINGDNPNGLYTAAGQPSNGVQRSMVEDVVYTFNEPVTITNANSAFTVLVANNSGGTVPGTLSAYEVANPTTGLMDGTSWAVSLTGNTTAGDGISPSALGSIANGEYTIQINPAYVFAAADGTTTMAAGTGRTDSFYCLFGDINGDEVVNGGDNLKLKAALASYNAAFDGNEDGFVNGGDNLIFKRDQSISYLNDGFTLTI